MTGIPLTLEPANRANFELEQQSHFVIGMERGCSFYLHAEIDIFGGGIGRLRHAGGRAVGEIRGILNHRYHALSSSRILGHQSDVGKSAGR